MADVTLKVGGDSGKAQQEITRLEKKVAKLENRVKSTAKTSRKSGKESQLAFSGLGREITKSGLTLMGLEKGYQLAIAGAEKLLQTQRQITQERNQVGKRLNQEDLKLQIQAGLTRPELAKRFPAMKAAAMLTPSVTDAGEMFQVQTQLHSSGFNADDLESGRALLAALNLKAATNQFGESMGDVKEVILSISQFRKAMGDSSPSATSIESTGGKLTQLFEGSDIQFPHLSDLAKVAAGLKSLNIGENQQLASFSALVDVMGSAESGTGLRQVASRLRGASESPNKVKALKSLGLNPEDVDLVGEDFITALERLKAAGAKVDEKTRSNALLNIFEERGQVAANTLLSQLPVVQERMKILEGDAYKRNVGLFQESPLAVGQRVKLRKEFAEYQRLADGGGFTFETAADLLRAQSAERAVMRPHTTMGSWKNARDRMFTEGKIVAGGFLGSQPSEIAGQSSWTEIAGAILKQHSNPVGFLLGGIESTPNAPPALPSVRQSPIKGIDSGSTEVLLKEGIQVNKGIREELQSMRRENGQRRFNLNAHTE